MQFKQRPGNMVIAARILVQVLLMILFGCVEVLERHELHLHLLFLFLQTSYQSAGTLATQFSFALSVLQSSVLSPIIWISVRNKTLREGEWDRYKMSVNLISVQSLLCCLAFFFAGIIDAVCGGGGLITIPTMLAVGIPVHFITGTNQCSAWLGSGVAAYDYIKSGNFHLKSALITLPFSMLGAFLGAKLNLLLPEQYLKIFMIISVPIIAIFIFTNKKLGETDRIDEKSNRSILLWSAVIGFVIGGYQGFYGPGGGLFFMLAYAAFLKLNLVRATGNTRFVVAISSITSVLTYAASGTVIWNLALAATVFYIVGSHLGATIAIKKGAKVIRPMMFCVIILLFAKLVSDLL